MLLSVQPLLSATTAPRRRIGARVVASLALTALAGCAIFEPDNRRTLNALDAELTPESTAGRLALAPIGLPLGVLAGTADLLIVHPVSVVADAWGDTTALLWEARGESRFRRALLLPLAALATPAVFVGDWLGRAAFAIPPREGT